jgi:hypothetical protein
METPMRYIHISSTALAISLLTSLPVYAGAAKGTIVTGKNPEYKLEISGTTSAPGQKTTYSGVGQVLLKGPLLVTSGAITKISSSSVQVGRASFQLVSTSKLCGKDGESLTVEAFKVGDNVKMTSLVGSSAVSTLRRGLVQFFGSPPQLDLVKTHLCE